MGFSKCKIRNYYQMDGKMYSLSTSRAVSQVCGIWGLLDILLISNSSLFLFNLAKKSVIFGYKIPYGTHLYSEMGLFWTWFKGVYFSSCMNYSLLVKAKHLVNQEIIILEATQLLRSYPSHDFLQNNNKTNSVVEAYLIIVLVSILVELV